jgi:chemotaxis protein histidine kinase CheA
LLLSRELIFKNNGSIEVESEPENGTIFKITLPVA